jgi:hypothetical protein
MSRTSTKFKISSIVICSLFILATVLIVNAKAEVTQVTNNNLLNPVPAPLTNSEIETIYPNLPTANQLWNGGNCAYLDTSNSNNGPGLTVSNYTSDEPNFLQGGVLKNVPHIWLQYNSTVWIEVPLPDLQSIQAIASPASSGTTWAIGAEAEPDTISGSYSVTGGLTFGEFGWTGSQTGDFVATVLSISDGTYIYQIGITDLAGSGQYINYQYWQGGNLINGNSKKVSVSNGVELNEYIQYNTAEKAWQFCFNYGQYYTVGSSTTKMVTGMQPNVVIESNDFTPSDFTSFAKQVGNYWSLGNGTVIYEAAMGYQFNNGQSTPGNWHPYYAQYSNNNLTHEPIPGALVYEGGTLMSAWNNCGVGSESPPSNLDLGIQAPAHSAEVLQFAYGYSNPGQGTLLWAYSSS